MSFHIAGLGTAVPEQFVDQPQAAEAAALLCCPTAAQQRLVKMLYARSGVRTRRSVLLDSSSNSHSVQQSFYGHYQDGSRGPTTAERMIRYEKAAGPLALAACRAALEDAGLHAGRLTHLVTVSCSGFAAPGFDLALVRDLPLGPGTARTHVGFMGCQGALNGLRVAGAFAGADPRACILLCAVELCTLHHQYTDRPDQIVANALFADGAAAVVGHQASGEGRTAWRVVAHGSTILRDSADLMGWHIRDHGFEMTLAQQVPELLQGHLRPWLTEWLAEHRLTIDSVRSWAVHPGGPRILQAAAEAIGLDRAHLADSWQVLAELGNMSSPTILFVLERLRQRDAARPCVALAFGPGLSVEAVLIR